MASKKKLSKSMQSFSLESEKEPVAKEPTKRKAPTRKPAAPEPTELMDWGREAQPNKTRGAAVRKGDVDPASGELMDWGKEAQPNVRRNPTMSWQERDLIRARAIRDAMADEYKVAKQSGDAVKANDALKNLETAETQLSQLPVSPEAKLRAAKALEKLPAQTEMKLSDVGGNFYSANAPKPGLPKEMVDQIMAKKINPTPNEVWQQLARQQRPEFSGLKETPQLREIINYENNRGRILPKVAKAVRSMITPGEEVSPSLAGMALRGIIGKVIAPASVAYTLYDTPNMMAAGAQAMENLDKEWNRPRPMERGVNETQTPYNTGQNYPTNYEPEPTAEELYRRGRLSRAAEAFKR